MPDSDFMLALLERLGGWGAFIIFLWLGGRQFMTLARDFSTGVLAKLDGIKDVLSGHERRLDRIDEALEQIQDAQKHPPTTQRNR
mgnify:FL=1